MPRPDLAAIRARGEIAADTGAMDYASDVDDLLAYIAALEPIARDVAAYDCMVAWGSEYQEVCGICDGHRPTDAEGVFLDDAPIEHAADCPVTRARALAIPPT